MRSAHEQSIETENAESLALTLYLNAKRAPTEADAAMRKALEKAGVEFANGKRPGVRMRG